MSCISRPRSALAFLSMKQKSNIFLEYAGHIGDSKDSESVENERRRLLSLLDRF